MTAPNSVLIVGGGTAGWMTACLMATYWPNSAITLVESDKIGTIGVGEGSTPYLKHFFRQIGLAEEDWMPASDATYKVGIQFNHWTNSDEFTGYFHPFFTPFDLEPGKTFFSEANKRRKGLDANVHPENYFLAAELVKQKKTPDSVCLPGDMDYAFHFDAGKLGELLKSHAVRLGVTHFIDDVENVTADAENVSFVTCRKHGRMIADLYIDCSGFRGLIAKQAQQRAFLSYSDTLFNDAAVAIATERDSDVLPQTESNALSNGWMWRIPLTSRVGNGYVYSSSYCSEAEAEQELREALGIDDSIPARHLKMQVGRLEQHWQGNCVAIGLSQGFIEPLEATALMLVQYAIQQLIDKYDDHASDSDRANYNRELNRMFDGIRDYIAAHYYLNTRSDTPYWRDCREKITLPPVLKSLVESWDGQEEFDDELKAQREKLVYLTPSWYCILAGMGRFRSNTGSLTPDTSVKAFFNKVISQYF